MKEPKNILTEGQHLSNRGWSLRHPRTIIIALALLVAAAAVAWFVAWPMHLINPDNGDNLLLTDTQYRPLKTTAPATLLYNRWFPDHDSRHCRILVRRPTVLEGSEVRVQGATRSQLTPESSRQRALTSDSLRQQALNTEASRRYPVVVVVQEADEDFNALASAWPAMDSCYVMIVSRTPEQNPRHNGLLRQLDTTLSHWLNHCGMQVDANDVTLVDRTLQGQQAREFVHRPVRHLLLTSPQGGLAPPSLGGAGGGYGFSARRLHLLPATTADTARMAQTFRQFEQQELDADLYPTGLSPWHAARAIALDRHPISQTRLRFTHRQAVARGYDARYVMFADFSIPSGLNRFFVYDYSLGQVVIASKCAHGCGSGSTGLIPQFSNEFGSCATSLGLYQIDDVHRMYKNGRIAINLQGLESTNDNARARGIKVHGGMRYEGEIHPRYLRLGKLSEGCFALSNIPLSAIHDLIEQTAPRHILLTAYTH